MKRVLLSLSSLLAVAACSPAGPIDLRVDIPDEPASGAQVIMPDTVIPANSEVQYCWVPEWTPDQDYLVSAMEGVQSSGGHHVVAFAAGTPRQPGEVFDCTTAAQMATLRPTILPDLADEPLMPEGFAARLPEGTQLVIQSHYINTNDDDILVRDVARFTFVPDEDIDNVTEANYFTITDVDIEVQPGEYSADVDCELVVEHPINILLFLGHMHDWGSHMSLSLQQGGVGKSVTVFQEPEWHVQMRDLPNIHRFHNEVPLQLDTGDRLTVNCNWDNTTGAVLPFPAEMCVALAYYWPVLPREDPHIICPEN